MAARPLPAGRFLLLTVGAVDPTDVRNLVRALERHDDDARLLRVRRYALADLPQQAPERDAALPLAAVLVWIGATAPEADVARRRFLEHSAEQCARAGIAFLTIVDDGAGSALRAFGKGHGLIAQRTTGDLDAAACAYAIRSALAEAARRKAPTAAPKPAPRRRVTATTVAAIDVRTGQDITVRPPLSLRPGPSGAEPAPAQGVRAAPSERALSPPPDAAPPEPVRLGASAPRVARPGDEFTARFVAYLARDEVEVGTLLERLSPRSGQALNAGQCRWRPGTAVTVRASGRHLQVDRAEQGFTWDGTRAMLDFDVTVDAAAPETTVVLKFDVAVDGIVVGRIRLDLELGQTVSGNGAGTQSAAVDSARTAFASYASQDRARVSDRVAAVKIATGLDIFLDCMALNPGEQWKARLATEIRARDLFLLFWSNASAASPWVAWEWRTALAEKGRGAIQVHPLESRVQPPEELKDLHFGDVHMLVREASLAQRATARRAEPPPD